MRIAVAVSQSDPGRGARGIPSVSVVHPPAQVARPAIVGAGTGVTGGALVDPGARIGEFFITSMGANFGRECVVGGVHVVRGVRACRTFQMRRGAMLRAGGTIARAAIVDDLAPLGRHATVRHDVFRGRRVVGTGARGVAAPSVDAAAVGRGPVGIGSKT